LSIAGARSIHDIVIRGGTIIDGTGRAAFTGDVAIADGRLAEVGGKAGPARRGIDAGGLLVTPGWVDVHTHYDGQAMWAENSPRRFILPAPRAAASRSSSVWMRLIHPAGSIAIPALAAFRLRITPGRHFLYWQRGPPDTDAERSGTGANSSSPSSPPLIEWPEFVCAENTQWFPGTEAAIPTAGKPDF
jgi:hypothetical protein